MQDARGSADNVAVFRAYELQLPVIWLIGVAPGWFQAIFPVHVSGPSRSSTSSFSPMTRLSNFLSRTRRWRRCCASIQYVVRETRQRVHQPVRHGR